MCPALGMWRQGGQGQLDYTVTEASLDYMRCLKISYINSHKHTRMYVLMKVAEPHNSCLKPHLGA